MEVNKPDKGVFKGIGALDKDLHINKKNFPRIRNKHQFDYTHNHGNEYQSNTNYFYRSKFFANKSIDRFSNTINQQQKPIKKIPNLSQIVLGQDRNDFKSLSQTNYRNYEGSKPPKPIYNKEQGIGFGAQSNNLFKTTNNQLFLAVRSISSKNSLNYKDWRGNQKFNPITGESKNIKSTFGYEDFKYSGDSERKYKANNFTRIPVRNQRFDIITGRKL